ncbi:MAG: hypothetical protein AAF587_43530 [Bacteroidota bacterium]
MPEYAAKVPDKNHSSLLNSHSHKAEGAKNSISFQDNRPELIAQRKMQEKMHNSRQVKEAIQLQKWANPFSSQVNPIQQKGYGADLANPLSSESASNSRPIQLNTPAWKRKAHAKKIRAKKRKAAAIEKQESRKSWLGLLFGGLLLSAGMINMYKNTQLGPVFGPSQSGPQPGPEPLESMPEPAHNQTALAIPESTHATDPLPPITSNPSLSVIPAPLAQEETGHGMKVEIQGPQDFLHPFPVSHARPVPVVHSQRISTPHREEINRMVNSYNTKNKTLAHPERFTKSIHIGLKQGATLARANTEYGQKPLLGRSHVTRALQGLDAMNKKDHDQFRSLYLHAGNTGNSKRLDRDSISAQRSALLKALGARSDIFASGSEEERTEAMKDMQSFAASIRAVPRHELMRQLTHYDINEQRSESGFDPTSMERAGRHPSPSPDRDTVNDGMFQQLAMSCGATSLMLARAEEDPVYALKLRDEVYSKLEQRRILEDVGSGSSSREGAQSYKLLSDSIPETDRHGHELLAYTNSTLDHLSDPARERLKELRAEHDGWPSEEVLAEIRSHPMTKGQRGTNFPDDSQPLTSDLAHASGTKYEFVKYDEPLHSQVYGRLKAEGMNRRTAYAQAQQEVDAYEPQMVKRLSSALDKGHSIPIGIPGHAMAVVDVRNTKKGQEFLINDPWTGRTLWFHQKDLFSGKKIAEEFGLPVQKERAIHQLLLPVEKEETDPSSHP